MQSATTNNGTQWVILNSVQTGPAMVPGAVAPTNNSNTKDAEGNATDDRAIAAAESIESLAGLWADTAKLSAEFYLGYGHKVLAAIKANKKVTQKALAERIKATTDSSMCASKLSRLLKLARNTERVLSAAHGIEIIQALHGNNTRAAKKASAATTPEDAIKRVVSFAKSAVEKHGVDPVDLLTQVADGIGVSLDDVNDIARTLRETAVSAAA